MVFPFKKLLICSIKKYGDCWCNTCKFQLKTLKDLVQVPSLPFIDCVTSFKPQFLDLLNRNNNIAYLKGCQEDYGGNAEDAFKCGTL